MRKSPVTTHILDTAKGCPAAQVPVHLFLFAKGAWTEIAAAKTDDDGRITNWFERERFSKGRYKIIFDTDSYLEKSFFPEVAIEFNVEDASEHFHVPLLLSPFGYSTYRGS
jgi:5-hydroxyisourate hydrolase